MPKGKYGILIIEQIYYDSSHLHSGGLRVMLTFEGRSKTVFLKLEHILEGLLLDCTLQVSDLVDVVGKPKNLHF